MNKTILVVDDDPSISAIFNYLLKQAGFTPLKASSGEECLQIIRKNNNIDLIFLDYKMSGINGKETLKKILKIHPNLPVIFMTGAPDKETITETFNTGAYGVIYKPFDVEEILSIIEKIFSTSSNE